MYKAIKRIQNSISHRVLLGVKWLFWHINRNEGSAKKVFFIVGCQRSGTTMLTEVLERDLRSKVFGEFSELSSDDPLGIRLNPLPSVREIIFAQKANLVVLKPLVESQNIRNLLDFFPQAKAVWVYRNYKSVASSNLKNFGVYNGINNLRPIVNNELGNWRSERVSDSVRKIICKHFSEGMNPWDAAALFWYVRNSFFFDLDLSSLPRVRMCKYEDFIINPERNLRKIYDQLGMHYPPRNITSRVHSKSISKGKSIHLSAEVEELCEDMYQRLERAYEKELKESSEN